MRTLGITKKSNLANYFFVIFFTGTLFTTYLSIGEEYIFVSWCITLIAVVKKKKTGLLVTSIGWFVVLVYYFITTILGLLAGLLNFKSFLEYIIQYPMIIMIVLEISNSTKDFDCSMNSLKIFIFLSVIYGLIEFSTHHNVLPDIFSNPVMGRIAQMNSLPAVRYQVSSFFLHYTYFGLILVVGMAINMLYPFKSQVINIGYYLGLIICLFLTKSRMCWLAAIVVIVYDLFSKKKITIKEMKWGVLAVTVCIVFSILFQEQVMRICSSIYNKFAIIFEYGYEYGSFGQRFGTLFNIPTYMFEHPIRGILGTGFQSIKLAFLNKYSYFQGYGIADNQLTTYLIEIGLIGTAMVIVQIMLFFINNRNKRSLSRYLLIIILVASITIDVVGTIYITILTVWPICLYYGYERKRINVKCYRR